MPLNHSIPSQLNSISRRTFALLLGVVAAGAWNGCTYFQPRADPTRFYVLTTPTMAAQPADTKKSAHLKIGLRTIEMPAYLQTKLMVIRTGADEIQFAEFNRWAEPLEEGISRVMKETIVSAGNVDSVALDTHGDDALDFAVRIQVLACEGVREPSGRGSAHFSMSWEIQPTGTNEMTFKRGVFTSMPVAWDGKDFGQLALLLSKDIVAAGAALAGDLPGKAPVTAELNGMN